MKTIPILCVAILMFSACKNVPQETQQEKPIITVSATSVKQGQIENHIVLNGTTVFLKQNKVLSSLTGYVMHVSVKLGDHVVKGQHLFDIQTKENKVLETKNITKIYAPASGVVNTLNVTEQGTYIVDGALLCSIVENANLYVKVSVPFEYLQLVEKTKSFKILLSDHSTIEGHLYKIFPTINQVSQTQDVYIKPQTSRLLPENLNVTIQFLKSQHNKVLLVPKTAVLTNETQSRFWVMKILKGKALITPVVKGIENDSTIEIASPKLKINDLVITEGAYGLPDSTAVTIKK